MGLGRQVTIAPWADDSINQRCVCVANNLSEAAASWEANRGTKSISPSTVKKRYG